MMTIIDMSSGETREASDDYSDEVLDTGWLPRPDPGPETALQEHELTQSHGAEEAAHVEHFLESYYRNQE